MSSALGLDDTLTPGQSLFSPNGKFLVTLQGDGNLVVYKNGDNKALWASDTFGKGGTRLIMQGDGNLVLYTAANHPIWASNTKGQSFARMQDDGNFVVYIQGSPTWASKTNQ